jgi:hypothetical protein
MRNVERLRSKTQKSIRRVVGTIISVSFWACIVPHPTQAASAVLDITPIDYPGPPSNNNYYVVFAARPASSSGSSVGHAFVGVGIEDYDLNKSSYVAYGVWPQGIGLLSTLHIGKLPPRVLQETLSKTDRDSSGHSPFEYSETLIVKVAKDEYDRVRQQIQNNTFSATAPATLYSYLSNDCATFTAKIATELGLQPPDRHLLTPGTWLPEAFIVKFREQVTEPHTIQYPTRGFTWTGPVLNGLPHGEGGLYGPNLSFHGWTKFGQFSHGRIDFPGGRSFDGTWTSYGEWSDGTFTSPEGTYKGKFSLGRPVDGAWKFKDGTRYSGTVTDKGEPKDGTYTWPDGSYESGRFGYDRRLDSGTYRTADGWTYKGAFPRGHFAYGTYTRPDGSKVDVSYEEHLHQGGVSSSSSGSGGRPYPGPPPVRCCADLDQDKIQLRLVPTGSGSGPH